MKTNKTARKSLQLKTETLARLDADSLNHVQGGVALTVGPGLTALDHSCNPACHSPTLIPGPMDPMRKV